MKGLSKSRDSQFCQCPKALWLKIYKPELEEIDDSIQSRFEQGNEVGDLAMGLLGLYIDVTTYREDGSLDISGMIEKTKQEIKKGTLNICEASFSFIENGISHYCAVDILHKEPTGWSIYEVKSSSYNNDKDDSANNLSAYIRDIVYQKWLLERIGINVTGTYLVRLDSNYIREGELDIHDLFHIKDMRELLVDEYGAVYDNISQIRKILTGVEPDMEVDSHCRSPYVCSFLKYCIGNIPEPNMFDLYLMRFSKKCDYYNQGKIIFEDFRDEKLSEVQTMQVESYLNKTEYIKPTEIKKFLNKLTFPLYFLDFETMQPAIPPFNKSKPYQQIPFQYSLHWIEEDGELKHTEFLGNSMEDPRRELAVQLCNEIPANACVTAYNKAFECSRLNEMAEIFPDLREHLLSISSNIVDLIEPFRGKMVYLSAMNGSFSIKKVLPALFPDDPELNYKNLAGSVHNGSEAMSIYPAIAKMSKEDAEKARKSLLEYCKLDTFAMVRIWEKLKEYADL